MAHEIAFAFIKPDAMAPGRDALIRSKLLDSGILSVVAEAEFQITEVQAEVHYDKDEAWCLRYGMKRHESLVRRGGTGITPLALGQEILRSVRAGIRGGKVHAFILRGENANAVLREIVGATDPAAALPGTIRSFSADSFALADEEMRPVRNIIHASECEEDAMREIRNLWPPDKGIRLR